MGAIKNDTSSVSRLSPYFQLCTRYVHELDKDGLLKEATKTSRFRHVDTAGELLRYVYLPELKRRDLSTEALEIGQNFFWRVVDVAMWSLPYNPQEAFDTFTSKERANNLFYRAIKCVRDGLGNCDNRTLMGDVTRERAANIISLAVWEDDCFNLELLRDAVALAKESTELDSNPELNILQEGHRALREARRTLWQLLADPVTAQTAHLVRSRPRSAGSHAPGTLKGPRGVLFF